MDICSNQKIWAFALDLFITQSAVISHSLDQHTLVKRWILKKKKNKAGLESGY